MEETSNGPQQADPATGTGSFFTPPEALAAVMENPPMGGGIGESMKMNPKAIGCVCNERHIIAWNYSDGLDVRVTADRIGLHVGEGGKTDWHIALATQEGAVMEAVATCGRWTCNQLVKFLRNAMTSRKNRTRKTKANRRARREAQAGQQPDGAGAAQTVETES